MTLVTRMPTGTTQAGLPARTDWAEQNVRHGAHRSKEKTP